MHICDVEQQQNYIWNACDVDIFQLKLNFPISLK